jgi:hypothetical protein
MGRRSLQAVAAGIMLLAMRVSAHHSFAAEFDVQKPITLTGAVTRVEWTNPHAHFYLDVTDSSGALVNWNFELTGPNGLLRRGWTPTSLNLGNIVTVDGYLAKDGSHYVNAVTVKLSDGRKVFAGSSSGSTQP